MIMVGMSARLDYISCVLHPAITDRHKTPFLAPSSLPPPPLPLPPPHPVGVESSREQESALAEEVSRLEQQQAWLRETFPHVFDAQVSEKQFAENGACVMLVVRLTV